MPILSKKNPRGSPLNIKGLTLLEMIIAISISSMIIGGSTFFILKTNSEAQTSKSRTKIHTEISTLIEKMNQIRNSYSSGTILVENSTGYDVLLFSNSWATTGILIGVVNLANPDVNGGVRLDSVSDFSKYGNRVIGVQEINKTQLTSVLSNPANVYAITFQANRYYSGLQVRNFSANTYNSGALIELETEIYERLIDMYIGQPKTIVAEETVLPFNLIF